MSRGMMAGAYDPRVFNDFEFYLATNNLPYAISSAFKGISLEEAYRSGTSLRKYQYKLIRYLDDFLQLLSKWNCSSDLLLVKSLHGRLTRSYYAGKITFRKSTFANFFREHEKNFSRIESYLKKLKNKYSVNYVKEMAYDMIEWQSDHSDSQMQDEYDLVLFLLTNVSYFVPNSNDSKQKLDEYWITYPQLLKFLGEMLD